MSIYSILSYLNPLVVILVMLPIAVMISSAIFRFFMDRNAKNADLTNVTTATRSTSKKHSMVDIYRNTPVASGVALSLTMLTMIAVFEFPTFEEMTLVDLGVGAIDIDEVLELPPQTEQKPPPPPIILKPEIIEIPDGADIEDEIEANFNTEPSETRVIEEQVIFDVSGTVPPPPAAIGCTIFSFVRDKAEFLGGDEALQAFIRKNFHYPRISRRLKKEGRVFVQFVVERDGSISNVTTVKGVHAPLDREAERVIKAMPHWKPGKQRGKPVRLRMTVPIVAKLR